MKTSGSELDTLMRELRRAPLHVPGRGERVDAGRDVIMRILPHRDPFLLVDRIIEFDPENRTMLAERFVGPDDPVFKGHFPGAPVYPACLQNEAAGQAGICLWSFAENDRRPCNFGIRIAKIEQALYLRPVLPGDTMRLASKLIYCDELSVFAAAQAYVGDELCSTIVVKAVLVDE